MIQDVQPMTSSVAFQTMSIEQALIREDVLATSAWNKEINSLGRSITLQPGLGMISLW